MSSQVNLKPTTLYTYGNKLTVDPGYLLVADNCIIDQPNVIESRRGFFLYSQEIAGLAYRVTQITEYKGNLLAHTPGPNTLSFDSDGAGDFLNFDGNYPLVDPGRRMRSLEANANFYFTSDTGIQKISVTGTNQFTTAANFINRAGAPQASDLEILPIDQNGFLTLNSGVAYRVLWGTKDANNNLILGTPSENVQFFADGVVYLANDLNNLLKDLDAGSQASTSDLLASTNFLSSLVLPNDAQAEEVRLNLIALASKLDNDFIYTLKASAVSAAVTSNVANVYFNAAISGNYINAGDQIEFTNITTSSLTALNATTSFPSWQVAGFINASAIYFNLPLTGTQSVTSDVALTALNLAVIGKSYNFRGIAAPTTIISGEPTGNQYSDLTTYYDNIVDQLHNSTSGLITSTVQPLGSLSQTGIQTKVQFSVPSEINLNNFNSWFYQIYRSAVATAPTGLTLSDINPGDELALVLEDNPTTADISNKFISAIDNTPDSFRGANLYTNQNSGEGILQSNDRPPVSKDIALFKNCTFYANTRTQHIKNITFLGTANLDTALSSSITSLSVSSGQLKLIFNSSITGNLSSGNVLSLTGFSGTSQILNDHYSVLSVSSNTAILSTSITGTLTDSTTADFGSVLKSESLNILRGASTEVYTFIPAQKEKTKFLFNAASTLNVGSTASYLLLNSANDTNKYAFYFPVGSATATPSITGVTLVAVSAATGDAASTLAQKFVNIAQTFYDFNSDNTSVTGSTAYVENFDYGTATDASIVTATAGVTASVIQQGFELNASSGYVGLFTQGTPSQNIFNTSKSFLRALNRNNNGQYLGFYLSGPTDTPGKVSIQTRDVTSTPFYLNVSTSLAGDSFEPSIPVSGTTILSDNQQFGNGLYYSKINQPDAVPSLANFQRIGQQDKEILRIIALRDSLFILKEEGVYRLAGTNPTNFSVYLFDTASRIISADSAVSLNNQIYCWTTQGIVAISDGGVEVLSRPIENELNKLVTISNFDSMSFGVHYDLDRSYLIWVPQEPGDTVAQQCFRYDFMTQSWTRWPIAKTAGYVLTSDNKLYLGAGDQASVEKERKSFDRVDYCDREFQVTLGPNSVVGSFYILNSIQNISVDDVFAQQQYVTLDQYNSLLNKLDIDPKIVAISGNSFTTSVSATVGSSLANSLVNLSSKIDSTLGLVTSTAAAITGASDAAPSSLQTAFNYLTTAINSATSVTFQNYPSISGYNLYESVINNVNTNQISIQTDIALPLIQGPCIVYNHIQNDVQWVPQHFGNPTILKHLREISMMFSDTNFRRGIVSFSTDLLPSFYEVPFNMLGDGTFGSDVYGSNFYGGGGSKRPLRTYIPRDKQRCTFLNIKFTHKVARSKWALYGVTVVGEMNAIENRAYK